MTITVGTATASEKEIKRHYPVTEGLTAGTTKQEGRTSNLEYDETFVESRYNVGIR